MTPRSPWQLGLLVVVVIALAAAWFVEGGEVLWLVVAGLAGVLAFVSGRFSAYVVALVAAVALGFSIGHWRFTEFTCGDAGGECDLAGLEGLLWAAGALAVTGVVIVALEVGRRLGHREARASADATR